MATSQRKSTRSRSTAAKSKSSNNASARSRTNTGQRKRQTKARQSQARKTPAQRQNGAVETVKSVPEKAWNGAGTVGRAVWTLYAFLPLIWIPAGVGAWMALKESHPGAMLLNEYLVPARISQRAFALKLGWTVAKLNELVNGKRGVTADSALDLSKALRTSPELWMNLQMYFDLHKAEQRRKKAS